MTIETKSLDVDSLLTMKKLERPLAAALPHSWAGVPLPSPWGMEAYWGPADLRSLIQHLAVMQSDQQSPGHCSDSTLLPFFRDGTINASLASDANSFCWSKRACSFDFGSSSD